MQRPVDRAHIHVLTTADRPLPHHPCDRPTPARSRGRHWAHGVLLLVLASGCDGKDRPTPVSSDEVTNPIPTTYGPVAREACGPDGTVRECGQVHHTDGDYVTCSEGEATCVGGFWGDCVGDHFVVRSAESLRLTNTGPRLLSLSSSTCANPCDPYCLQVAPEPSAVSGNGIVSTDAGVTLEWREIESSGTGPCVGMQCQLVDCGAAATTTISGRVYDPAGKNPMYGAEVYIPLRADTALPPFGNGASCDTCGGAAALDAIRATQTDANGNFVLSGVPVGTVAAATGVPVVVQMGKWRREIVLKTVTGCGDNVVTGNCSAPNPADCVFRLPRNQKDGYDPVAKTYTKADMPKTAIVTGAWDPFDCLLLKAGIDPSEVGDKNSSKRIHLYTSEYSSADPNGSLANVLGSAYGTKVNGGVLWNSTANMLAYDAVLLPCDGVAADKTTAGNTPYKNLIDYVNAGGRAFATHWSFSWLAYPQKYYPLVADNWSAVADWTPPNIKYDAVKRWYTTEQHNTQEPMTNTVNTSFPKGGVFSQWLTNVQASSIPGRMKVHDGRHDLASIGAKTQSWMTGNDTNYVSAVDSHRLPGSTYTNLFTFNTPYGAAPANQCGRVVYSDFHVSTTARTPCPPGGCGNPRACLNDAECGFTATCSKNIGAVGQCSEPCNSPADCPNTTFACSGNLGTCTQTTCTVANAANVCGVGQSCFPLSKTCMCNSAADCNGGACTKACDPGTACHSNAQCGNGSCGTGSLGSKVGSCAKGAICHNNSQCGPSGTCGVNVAPATGATKGACARGTTTVCHKNSDCDNNVCGTGASGSTAGTCSSSNQACASGSDCDSGACAGGTCPIGASTACHLNADCDSGVCGSTTPGTCTTSGQSCHANSTCDSGVCGGTGTATSSTKGTCNGTGKCSVAGDCTGGATCTGTTGNKHCTGGCNIDTDCDGTGAQGGVAGICTNAECTTQSCTQDTNCTKSGSVCNGAKCSTPLACTGNTDCKKSLACAGAKCTAKACAIDTNCTKGTKTCNNAKCGTAPACATDADPACLSAGSSCIGATCSTSTCSVDTQCPAIAPAVAGVCNGATCNASACSTNSDCGGATCGGSCGVPACSSNADCASGLCKSGVCACSAEEDCGSAQDCSGETKGSCSRACTTDAECSPDRCVGGQCGGCTSAAECHDYGYPNDVACTGIPAGNKGVCSAVDDDQFPVSCIPGDLTPQEKALEFMFFDLTSCVTPDNLAPPKPVTSSNYGAAVFVQDFTSACPMGASPIWRSFDWQAEFPPEALGASIDFSAQSGPSTGSLLPAAPVVLGQAIATTVTGSSHTLFDRLAIDTGVTGGGAFNTATPAVVSSTLLRVTIGLNPSTDKLYTPRLTHWKVQYDCPPDD